MTYTPPRLAKHWNTTPETVIDRIKSGDLQAFTLSPPTAERPRWRITEEAVAEYERLHSPQVTPKPQRTPKPQSRRTPKAPEYTEYV